MLRNIELVNLHPLNLLGFEIMDFFYFRLFWKQLTYSIKVISKASIYKVNLI